MDALAAGRALGNSRDSFFSFRLVRLLRLPGQFWQGKPVGTSLASFVADVLSPPWRSSKSIFTDARQKSRPHAQLICTSAQIVDTHVLWCHLSVILFASVSHQGAIVRDMNSASSTGQFKPATAGSGRDCCASSLIGWRGAVLSNRYSTKAVKRCAFVVILVSSSVRQKEDVPTTTLMNVEAFAVLAVTKIRVERQTRRRARYVACR